MLLDAFVPTGGSSAMSYDWRLEDEPSLARRCRLRRGCRLPIAGPGELQHYARLQQAGVLAEPTYICETVP